MRWNCPHCGIRLGIVDDKVGSQWEFSKCYSCSGFAMVRKSDVDLIKIDKVPPGEKVLLPESSESLMLSREAAIRLASFTQMPLPIADAVKPDSKWRISFSPTPWVLGAAGMLALCSGIYFLKLGREILEKPTQKIVATAPVVVSDSLRSQAMAPLRHVEEQLPAPMPLSGFFVRPRSQSVAFHSGPGLGFPVVGTAEFDSMYAVTDWADRWFKVRVKTAAEPSGVIEAWIHNGEVQLVPQN